jgi:hypothetical protein
MHACPCTSMHKSMYQCMSMQWVSEFYSTFHFNDGENRACRMSMHVHARPSKKDVSVGLRVLTCRDTAVFPSKVYALYTLRYT